MIKNSPKKKLYKGFTLAEVLLTLIIVGIVAALTIPSLITNIQESNFKTAYKKSFSVANQALAKATSIDAIVAFTNDLDYINCRNNFNAFKNQFSINKTCYNNDNANCWPSIGEKWWNNGYPTASALSFIDNSGIVWSDSGTTGGTCTILLDTNGNKEPNKFGRDRFAFSPRTASGDFTTGITVKFTPNADDVIPATSTSCPSGNCYYKSWLLQ